MPKVVRDALPTLRLARRYLLNGFCVAAVVFAAVLIAPRWLRFLPGAQHWAVDSAFEEILIWSVQFSLWTMALGYALLPLWLAGTAAFVLLLGNKLLIRENGTFSFSRIGWLAIGLSAPVWQIFLDFNRDIFLAHCLCLTMLPIFRSSPVARLGFRVKGALAVCTAVTFAGFAQDVADSLTLFGSVFLACGLLLWLARQLNVAAAMVIVVAAAAPASLTSALLPVALTLHDGVKIGEGLAYDFCENREQGLVFASVPGCSSLPMLSIAPQRSMQAYATECIAGRVEAYRTGTVNLVKSIRPFGPDFFGRIEQLECTNDSVLAAVQQTGRRNYHIALEIDIDTAEATPLGRGLPIGNSVQYDAERDAIFLGGEYTHAYVRIDRRTGDLDASLGEPFRRSWLHPLLWKRFSGSGGCRKRCIDLQRNLTYYAEFMQGRHIWSMDLDTLQPIRRFDMNNGGGLGLELDRDRNRLLVSGFYGVDVIDGDRAETLARFRTGFGPRSGAVDLKRRLLYLPSTGDGKIRIYDLDGFSLLAQIPVGIGIREILLSHDGRWLYGSSAKAHYVWDTSRIALAR